MQKGESSATLIQGQILTVSELSSVIKGVLECGIAPCWVRGEISGVRRQASGHTYFTLKDQASQISAVLFRGDSLQQTVVPQDGVQVLLFGEMNVFPTRGTYQLIARFILDDGVGQLKIKFEQLKQKLEAEGLFAPERKKAIPVFPRVVGFITSPTGAAIQDFISILKRRNWIGTVVVIPSLVQGEEAAAQMVAQLKFAQTLTDLDLLVIGRGGGSLEDLWCFNDEQLVRAVADCKIPIISAVGHEIDFCLTDFAADKRAETPSAAAELITNGFIDHMRRWGFLKKELQSHSPMRYIEKNYFLLDDLQSRLYQVVQQEIFNRKEGLQIVVQRFHAQDVLQRIVTVGLQYTHMQKTLEATVFNALKNLKDRFEQLKHRYAIISLQSILNRGFAIVRDSQNLIVDSIEDLKEGEELNIQLRSGSLSVRVERIIQ